MNDMQIHTMNLRSKIIAQDKIIEAYRSSEKYECLREVHRKSLREKDACIDKLKQELVQDSLHLKKVIREWFKVTEEMEKEHSKQLASKDKKISQIEEQLQKFIVEVNALYEQEAQYKLVIQNLTKQLETSQGKKR